MIEGIIKALEENTKVTVNLNNNDVYLGSHVSVGMGVDPRNPGKDLDYMVIRAPGDVDCWIPYDVINSIEIHLEKS